MPDHLCRSSVAYQMEWLGGGWQMIIATRGEPKSDRHASMILNWLEHPRTNRHSEKPQAFRGVIEKISPAPRLELFARNHHEGWHVWGNEVDSDVELSVLV